MSSRNVVNNNEYKLTEDVPELHSEIHFGNVDGGLEGKRGKGGDVDSHGNYHLNSDKISLRGGLNHNQSTDILRNAPLKKSTLEPVGQHQSTKTINPYYEDVNSGTKKKEKKTSSLIQL